MAINIHHTYNTDVNITFYADNGVRMHTNDCGMMDDIAVQVCEVLVKHNFTHADICSAETGEVLMIIERT